MIVAFELKSFASTKKNTKQTDRELNTVAWIIVRRSLFPSWNVRVLIFQHFLRSVITFKNSFPYEWMNSTTFFAMQKSEIANTPLPFWCMGFVWIQLIWIWILTSSIPAFSNCNFFLFYECRQGRSSFKVKYLFSLSASWEKFGLSA